MTGWSRLTRFAEGVVQNILGFIVGSAIVGSAILAGIGYISNLLALMLVGSSLTLALAVIFIAMKLPHGTSPRTPAAQAEKTAAQAEKLSLPKTRIPRRSLKHVVTVTLDTEVEPFDHYSDWFEEEDEIEVDVKSVDSASFHFLVCDEEDFNINRRRYVNFEYYEGKEYTSRFKKRFAIPATGMWYFIAYTPEGEDYTMVNLKISRV